MSSVAKAPPPLERLHRRAAGRAAGMGAEEAAAWIAGHGLLSMAAGEELPAAVRERLRPRVLETAAHNLYAVARFQEVVDALSGLPVCPLKGIHLLDTVYREDPQSRPLSDLDLLVPEPRVEEAVSRLAGLGLRETASSRGIRDVSPERVLTDGRLAVEVHSRLGIKHGRRSTWGEVTPVPGRLHDREVFVLDRETTLVHLVSHLVKHRPFSRLVWVEDVLRWTAGGVDAERAVARAGDLGALRSLVAGVRVLRRALGPLGLAAVPERPPGVAGGLAVRLNERLLWRDLLADPWSAGLGTPGSRTLSALLLSDRGGDALRFSGAKLAELLRRK